MSTKIEWTDVTWNPITGCAKVSAGCKNCYAERLWPKVEGARVKREGGEPRPFTDVRCHPERVEQPLHWRNPRRVFVNSMSDLFHDDVPDEFLDSVWRVMLGAKRHSFQILTKRPERMLAYLSRFRPDGDGWVTRDGKPAMGEPQSGPLTADDNWPPSNIWLGVSAEDQATADERIPLLLQTPAAVRFVSYEPALGPVNFGLMGTAPKSWGYGYVAIYGLLHWIIAGGESGPDARPAHPDWFRAVRDECAAAGVPFFFKQWGEWEEVESEWRDDDWFVDGDKRNCLIAPDSTAYYYKDQIPPDVKCRFMNRAGKKAAGRLLDGREHSEYPA